MPGDKNPLYEAIPSTPVLAQPHHDGNLNERLFDLSCLASKYTFPSNPPLLGFVTFVDPYTRRIL